MKAKKKTATPSHSSTVDAIIKSYMDAIATPTAGTRMPSVIHGEWPAELPDMATASAPVTPKIKPLETTHWPAVLKNEGLRFSDVFSEAWAEFADPPPDFKLPALGEHEYPEWMQAYIPTESDYKAPAQLVYDAALAYAAGSVTHLVGWPGTGKTNGLPVFMAYKLGLPLLRLGLNKKGMMFDDLIGREAILQSDEGTTTGHKDGLLIPWITHPAIILADEFSRANPEISNGLMSLMERNGCLIVENRAEPIVRRHQNCWILASDNVKGLGDGLSKFVGTDMVDNAVLDRFEITLEVDYLSGEDQRALLAQWFDGFPADAAKKIVDFGLLIQSAYKKDTLPLSFSPRTLKEVGRYSCLYQSPKTAIQKVVLSRYADEADVQAVGVMFQTAFGYPLEN